MVKHSSGGHAHRPLDNGLSNEKYTKQWSIDACKKNSDKVSCCSKKRPGLVLCMFS
jgi:hypothetical protein